MVSPQEAFSRMRGVGDYGSPLLFAMLAVTLGAVLQGLWSFVFPSLRPFAGEGLPQFGVFSQWLQGFWWVFTVVLAPFGALLGVFLGAGLLHLSWLLVSGFRSAHGFEATLRVVSYAAVAQMLGPVVPVVGPFFAALWTIALQVVGMMAAQKASLARAVVAVLLPMLGCCFALMAVIALVMGAAALGLAGAGLGGS